MACIAMGLLWAGFAAQAQELALQPLGAIFQKGHEIQVVPSSTAGSTGAVKSEKAQEIAAGAKVLLLACDDGPGPLQAILAGYADVIAVDWMNECSALPTMAQLKAYDVVIAWSNGTIYDPVGIGNLLADYIDAGGKLVLCTFMWQAPGENGIQGRLIDQLYSPLVSNSGGDHYAVACLGTYASGSLLMEGVASYCDDYRDYTNLVPGATLVASWDDGENFVAQKGCVVAINSYMGPYYDASGDFGALFHNAVSFLSGGCSSFTNSFADDLGRSRVCVNTKTGAWQYNVLSGLWKGVYTGKSSVSKTSDRWTFRSVAGSPRLMLLTFYPQMFRATASLGGSDFVSQLSDRNTKDDPAGCSAN